MYQRIDLQGLWDFQLDEKKEGLKLPLLSRLDYLAQHLMLERERRMRILN